MRHFRLRRQGCSMQGLRRDRGWYDASAWRQHSDYGRGRGYGRDYAGPVIAFDAP